MKMEALGSNK